VTTFSKSFKLGFNILSLIKSRDNQKGKKKIAGSQIKIARGKKVIL